MDDLQANDPTVLGKYTLVGRLGSGGFGIVYLATDPLGNQVAIKVLRSELADDQRLRTRLAREARAIAAVQGTRAVKVFEVVTDGPFAYLVMEYVEGTPLDELVEAGSKPEGHLLWFIALGLVEALQEIHAAGITHRDLKPSNVIIGPDGVKVVDFGISAITDEAGFTQTGALMGSAGWLSPEQITGAAIDQSTDVFNLGLILGYLASGKHPFGVGRPDAVMYRVTAQDPEVSSLPTPFRTAVERCLQKSPADRPVLQDLHEFFLSGGSDSSVNAIGSQALTGQTFLVQPADIEAVVAAGAPAHSFFSEEHPSQGLNSRTRKKRLVGLTTAIITVAAAVLSLFLLMSRDTRNSDLNTESEVQNSIAPPTSAPTVKSTVVRPTTTTEPPNLTCYLGSEMRLRGTTCQIPRANRTKELNFLSSVRIIIGVDAYNTYSPEYQSAEDAWLTIGYALCEGLSYSQSYVEVMDPFRGIQGEFEYELIFNAAIRSLCEQLNDLIP